MVPSGCTSTVVVILAMFSVSSWCSATSAVAEAQLCKLHSSITVSITPQLEVYLPNATIHFSCRNELWTLKGNDVATCEADGKWSQEFPTCEENSVKTAENRPEGCSQPLEPFPTGLFTLSANSTIAFYRCNSGYQLVGSDVRHCLANRTWSSQVPECVFDSKHGVAAATDTFEWLRVFENNLRWEGMYEFNGQPVSFLFLVQSTLGKQIEAILRDQSSQFEVTCTGVNSSLTINLTQLLDDSPVLDTTTSWSATGQLDVVDNHWVFSGVISSSRDGFSRLTLSPSSKTEQQSSSELLTSDDDYADELPGSMALILGIAMAAGAIIIAGSLAAFCVRRNLTTRSQGHQSLTSFENPVYDCENLIVLK